MVNIPSNLQGIWDEVSKDGKIDQADAKKLLNAAAPGLENAKTADEIDKITSKELGDDERNFLQNFAETSKGVVLDVKNGTAKGSFEFVDKKPENASSGPKLFEPLKLPENPVKLVDDSTPAKDNKAESNQTASPQAEVNDSYTEKIKKLNDLKASLPKIMSGDALKQELAKVDSKIKKLEESRVKDKFISASKSLSDNADKSGSEALANSRETLLKEYNKLPESMKNDSDVKSAYESAMPKLFSSSINSFLNEISNITDTAINEALKTGNVEILYQAKKSLDNLLVKYAALKDDPIYKEFKDVLSGKKKAAPAPSEKESKTSSKGSAETTPSSTQSSPVKEDAEPKSAEAVKNDAYGKIDRAIALINNINSLISSSGWSGTDRKNADEYFKALPDGPFKNRLKEKMTAMESIRAQNAQRNKANELEGLHDVIGNGFFNAKNKEGTKAMFQLMAVQGNLDENIKSLNYDDQKEAIKILTSDIKFDNMNENDRLNLAIASAIYENISQSSNVDDDFNKKLLKYLKDPSFETFEGSKVNEDSFCKGLKYSMYSEKEAAVTMARGLINGDVPASVLSKFNSEELNTLLRVVEKNGSSEEKNLLLKKMSESYTSGASVDITALNKNDKGKIVKEYLTSDKINDAKLDTMIKKVGNDSIIELVNKEDLNDKQLSVLAKRLDGDAMADNPDAAAKLLVAMIKSYNREQNGIVSLADINNFVDEIDKDWWEDDDTMKKVIKMLGDGPDSDYARFRSLAPATLDKIYSISD